MAEPPSVLVIGAGSIGARHAKNLRDAGADVCVMDIDSGRASRVGASLGVGALAFDLERAGSFDGVVVATPTRYHLEHLVAVTAGNTRVLVEKPIVAHLDELDQIDACTRDRIMVAYNLRFHEPVRNLVEHMRSGSIGEPVGARVWFGSWLPDWRPDVDYRTTYSARRDLGGGVLNDAIHELDIVVWLFGADCYKVAGAYVGRVGPLDIDVEDTVYAVLHHSQGFPILISLDYLSRRYRRGIEIVGSEGTLRLDWARSTLEKEDASGVQVESVDVSVTRSYEQEAAAFLEFVRGGEPYVSFEQGASSVRLVDAIRQLGVMPAGP